ncbi:MAG: hypothetical protein CMO80_04925 [Verrucomicrobiales bacterium]|nr:hypothetical protein [Verrucomicrobiales bacterium]|tara:strand:+ start:9481 stop:10338 length:858 start_codon:yes stop_codon:yes gene_type:complete
MRTLSVIIMALSLTSSHAAGLPAIPVPVPEQASPVKLFRDLLAKSPGERDAYLVKQTPKVQSFIRQRLARYEAMSPEVREMKLQTTELRFFLRPQLTTNPAQRQIMLATTPPQHRETIRQRIERWDALAPELQQQIIKNESMLNMILRVGDPAEGVTGQVPGKSREELTAWNSLPHGDRLEMLDKFRSFFEFNVLEKERIIASLPEYQRNKITGTISALQNLSPEQRAACLKALQRFGSMTVARQQRFFRNADAWAKITPEEKRAWRLVVREAPPLPGSLQAKLF